MNLKSIIKLISEGESTTLELKKSTARLKSACETACAFLNTDGGSIVVGATDGLKIVGQEVSDKTKRSIGNELAKISPKANIEVHYIRLKDNDKFIIIFHITTDSTKRPYMYNGKAYLRSQCDTIPMPMEYLKQLTISNVTESKPWEMQTLNDVDLEELDTDEILATIKEGIINNRIPGSYITEDAWQALEHLGLIEKNEITNAALVLFGKESDKKHPQCLLRLARFRGTNKDSFIDNKQTRGNIFKLLREAMLFAQTHLPISSEFPKNSIRRIDTPLFPVSVIREAIANALCHRDYSYYGGSMSFAIFDDRLEIWNYGLLPSGLTVDKLKTLNCSVPRNRRIANVLYYHKIFESWGRGVQMILSECKKAGHPEPYYAQSAVGTLLTMPSKEVIGNTQKIASQMPGVPFEALSSRQQEIVSILRNHHSLTPDELRRLMEKPPAERTFRDELNRLKACNYIDSDGKTRKRKWFSIN